MKGIMNQLQRRRKLRSFQATVVGTVLVFGMLAAPIANAEVITVEESQAAPSFEAGTVKATPSGVDASLAKISSEEAVSRIKSLVPLFKEAEMSGVRLTDSNSGGGGQTPVWQINWSIHRGNSSYGFSSEVNAVTGDLINLGLPYDLLGEPTYFPPKLNESEALTIARSFISKAVPSLGAKAEQLERSSNNPYGYMTTPLFGPVVYSFAFDVYHEEVKVQGQPLSITVNGDGDVTNFHYSNSGLEYPSSKPKTTLAEAQKRLEQDLQLQLTYFSSTYPWDNAPSKWRLTYVPSVPLSMLDAKTGQWVDWENKPVDAVKPNAYIDLQTTGEPYKARRVTAEEAIKSIESYADIPGDYTVQSQQLNRGQGKQHDSWYIRWSQQDNSFMAGGRSAQVDAETGQILSFNIERYGPYLPAPSDQPKPVPLSLTKAIQISDQWMQANILDANKYKRVDNAQQEVDESTGTVTINYVMFHKGIPVQNQSVGVTLDPNGRVAGIYAQAGIESYDVLDGLTAAIKPEQAKASYLAALEMKLNYVRSGGYNTAPSGEYIPAKLTLGYVISDKEYGESIYRIIDAVTGELIIPYEDNRTKLTASAADIQSHWARESLQAALDHGVLIPDDNGHLNPDQFVTKGQFIRMAARAMNPSTESYSYSNGSDSSLFADVDAESIYYRAVSDWIGKGWLKSDAEHKLQPEQALTRDQLAVYLATMTGYSKLSERLGKDKEVTALKDLKAIKNPGAVALALKLGLLSASEGSFKPNAKVTVAEAAVALLRLAKIEGSLDQPIMQRYY
mgnify:CR=1 FL=1